MSLLETAKSLFVIPKSVSDIQPIQALALYGLWTTLIQKMDFWSKVKEAITTLMGSVSEQLIPMVYAGVVPDSLIRLGIRLQLRAHLIALRSDSVETELQQKMAIVKELTTMPIAIETDAANAQHYEVPAKFYDLCLGPKKKYSSGYWPTASTTFEESETVMLDLYCERAQLEDGMSIVDLGCGWGSLALHLCEKYPNSKITAISNSNSQREYIIQTAKDRGLNWQNINVITCNVADDKGALDGVKNNDRVMTVEMFEHMKNYNDLLKKVHGFLKPKTGKLFVHIFSHKDFTYHFDKGWMSDTFFSGGTMPSDDLLLYFAQDFSVESHWRVNGTHYYKTCNGWLDYLDKSWSRGELKPVLAQAYGEGKEQEWFINWRLFFLACAELFGLEQGNEWIVSHYLFQRR